MDLEDDLAADVSKATLKSEAALMNAEAAEDLKDDLWKCMMLSVLNAVKIVKFLSNLPVINLFFAVIASKVKAEEAKEAALELA